MKKLFFFSFCAILLIVSCQKEVSESVLRGNGTDSTNTGLLRKQVTTYLADSTDYFVYEFEYDTAGRLIKRRNTVKFRKPDNTIEVKGGEILYHRDGRGRLIQIEYPPSQLYSDISYITVEYQDTLSTKVSKMYDNLDKFMTLYSYDQNNHIQKTSFYHHFPQPTDPMTMTGYHLHNYDSKGNLLEKRFFQDDDHNGTFESPVTFLFEHDDKINPWYPVDDALLAETWSLVSPNNTVRQFNITPGPRIPGDTLNYHYTYDTRNRPVKCWQDSLNVVTYFYD